MPRPKHYSPALSRRVVGALYHEAKRRRQPMTRLVDELLTGCLLHTRGWQTAHTGLRLQEAPHPDLTATAR